MTKKGPLKRRKKTDSLLDKLGGGVQVTCIILIILICLIHSVKSTYTVDFIPINGTFQNFNVVRRLLDHQIPYKDFSIYLGLGHLYLGSFFTKLFGGNFSASLVAFNFLTMISLSLISIIIGKIVLGKTSKTPYTFTVFLLVTLLLLQYSSLFTGNNIINDLKNALASGTYPGNSARFIRGLALPFIILFSYGVISIIDKLDKKKHIRPKLKKNLQLFAISIGAGISFLWSNDYGIACFLCSTIMVAFVTFSTSKKFGKTVWTTIKSIIISFLTIFIITFIVTRGHPSYWLDSILASGGTQGWYYGTSIQEKVFYIFDINITLPCILLVTICLYNLYKMHSNAQKGDNYISPALLAFITMASFATINEYRLLSGGNLLEVAYSVLDLILSYSLIKYIVNNIKNKKNIVVVRNVVLCVGFCYFLSTTYEVIVSFSVYDRGTYVEELGGYLKDFSEDIKFTKELIEDKKVFSTYSSALEVVTDQYQPSGTDYIIHSLGEKNRNKYLNSFKNDKFSYVTTINENYSEWEFWIKNANWFFYRELFSSYIPTNSNSYQIIWEKDEKIDSLNTKVEFDIISKSASLKTIKIKTDKKVNGIMDLQIKYETTKNNGILSKTILNSMVLVSNKNEKTLHYNDYYSNWFLPDKNTTYIPVTIIDGEGEIDISSLPERHTSLEIQHLQCKNIFTTYFDYVTVDREIEVQDDKIVLEAIKDGRSAIAVKDAKTVDLGDKNYEIYDVVEFYDHYNIILNSSKVDEIEESLKKQNVIYIEK